MNKNKSINKFVVAGVLAVASYGVGSAQNLVGYNFTGLSGIETNYPKVGQINGAEVTAAANLADGSAFATGTVGASAFSRGSNDTNNVGYGQPNNYHPTAYAYFTNNVFGVSNYQGTTGPGGANQTSIATGITKGSYVTFSLTSDAGTTLDISSLTFQAGTSNGGAQILGLAYSINGGAFTTAGIQGGDAGLTPTTAPAHPYNGTPDVAVVDLSGIAALQGVSGTVAFDLLDLGQGYATTSFGHGNTAFTDPSSDDITVGGTVVSAVPEPSSYALLSVGLLSLMAIARRKVRA